MVSNTWKWPTYDNFCHTTPWRSYSELFSCTRAAEKLAIQHHKYTGSSRRTPILMMPYSVVCIRSTAAGTWPGTMQPSSHRDIGVQRDPAIAGAEGNKGTEAYFSKTRTVKNGDSVLSFFLLSFEFSGYESRHLVIDSAWTEPKCFQEITFSRQSTS